MLRKCHELWSAGHLSAKEYPIFISTIALMTTHQAGAKETAGPLAIPIDKLRFATLPNSFMPINDPESIILTMWQTRVRALGDLLHADNRLVNGYLQHIEQQDMRNSDPAFVVMYNWTTPISESVTKITSPYRAPDPFALPEVAPTIVEITTDDEENY